MVVSEKVYNFEPEIKERHNGVTKDKIEILKIASKSFLLEILTVFFLYVSIRCISNFRVSAFSDLHHKNKKLSSNEWADRPPDRDKTGRRYRQNPRMSHAFYYEGSCKPSSHARGLNGSRRQTGEHTCVGRSFVIRFRELCAKLLCITHRT